MVLVAKTRAAVRIDGDNLDPRGIGKALGAVGDARLRQIKRNGVTVRRGSWRFNVNDRSPGDLNGQIRDLLSALTQDVRVWKEITQRYRSDVFCGLFMNEANEMADLAPDVLTMLGERGLKLVVDIYDGSE